MPNGVITDVNLLLNDLTHTTPRDIDLLLSASNGRRVLVMSDVGNVSLGQEDAVVNIDLALDDEAGTPLPVTGRLFSGTFQPTNLVLAGDPDSFAAPAPAPDGNVALSTFDGADPNGTWQVWVMDNVLGQGGDFGGGWELRITPTSTPPRLMSEFPPTRTRRTPGTRSTRRGGSRSAIAIEPRAATNNVHCTLGPGRHRLVRCVAGLGRGHLLAVVETHLNLRSTPTSSHTETIRVVPLSGSPERREHAQHAA